ncbi:tenascin [Odontesthes bonariensis]|uniref:tenascin n=1 Tax=Odontesthes bonariensis TaxID=219752 RepID=UPI003F587BCB
MTHKISLLPGGCTGGCEAEMATLKGRVARLEREMSSLKEKCPCSANCPNDCSGNGECEKGKCICQQGFMGSDCNQCAHGADCNRKAVERKPKSTEETGILKVNKDKENMQKQRKGSPANETDTNVKASDPKPGVAKPQEKQDTADKKINVRIHSVATKPIHPSTGQIPKYNGIMREEVRKGKPVVKKVPLKPESKGDGTRKLNTKSDHLKDEPQSKKMNSTTRAVTIPSKATRTNKTQERTGKESLEQSTLMEKNVTRSSEYRPSKTSKSDSKNVQSIDNRKVVLSKTEKEKTAQKSQSMVNATITAASDGTKLLHNKTSIHGSGISTRKTGGLGSVTAVNISSYTFTVIWSSPQGMFKNFTVIRREPRTEGDEDEQEGFEEEVLGRDKTSAARNATEVHSESTNTTSSSAKAAGSRNKAETKRVSMVVPGNVRSVEFSNLRANMRYVLHVYGTAADRRSKIHRVTATTGPEPPTEMVFSNVTESSLAVSWAKPKTMLTGFRVTYINAITGESRFVTVDSLQSHVVLSGLSTGSSYIVSVASTRGRVQSDELTSTITTVPAPPTRLQVVNITDTRAVLQWTPSLGKVDRFIISYESSKIPNVTVTVMLPGNLVEHQLRGLQRGTLYTVKVLSQKDSLQSTAILTRFTTANVVKAGEVGARSAVIAWRTPVVYHSYRVIYQVAGEETKEVILEPTVTQYKLKGLLPTSRYIVVVQGEKNGHYTSVVTSEFITGKLRFPFPTECSQELLNGALQSGEVDIYPQGKDGGAVRVYCDMETDGGGWTVFQRRMNGKADFYRTWNEYKAGFGNLSEEFWLGNELLHKLTGVGPVSLRVDMRSENETAYAHYANFSIASEDRNYPLKVSGYTGTAGDSMTYHNGRPFSARDKNPDPVGIHCAKAYMGGWWYKNCYKTNLNGLYGINSNNQGVVWIDWKGKDFSIPFTEMKFRPSRFSPTTHG